MSYPWKGGPGIPMTHIGASCGGGDDADDDADADADADQVVVVIMTMMLIMTVSHSAADANVCVCVTLRVCNRRALRQGPGVYQANTSACVCDM